MRGVSVWAPHRDRVDLIWNGQRIALEKDQRGYWSSDCVRPGDDYAFSIDGGRALPDPRAPWLPYGVEGPARALDHDTFDWTDTLWQPPPFERAIVYELHVGTFSRAGTFAGAIEHLDALVELGVSHVELMPVNSFAGPFGWGYDGVGLFAPHEGYGGPNGLKALVDACHARGLAVILDVVYNHLGPKGDVLSEFGPYFTDRHTTPWGRAVNLDDADSDEVRRFFLDNATSWLCDHHADGLRIDAVHALYDASATHFLEELSGAVEHLERELGRTLVLVAESDLNDPRIVRARSRHGYGLRAQWSDDFHHALHALTTGEADGYYADFGTLGDLAHALTQAFVYDGRWSKHRRRRHGRPIEELGADRFVVALQNHDQVGNRALGERIADLAGVDLASCGAAVLLLGPCVPMLFQGEEWAASSPFQYFADHGDPELARAVREGRRREFAAFGWPADALPDPAERATFERSKLDWDERTSEPHARVLAWYSALIALRRRHSSLAESSWNALDVQFDEASHWLTMARGVVVLAVNFGRERVSIPLAAANELAFEIASKDGHRLTRDALSLPAETAWIATRRERHG